MTPTLFNRELLDLLRAGVAVDYAGQPRRDNITTDDIHGGLALIASERSLLDQTEVQFLEAALDRGESLSDLATVYDVTRQALTKRYYALGGDRRPLVGVVGAVAPEGTIVDYWMARTEAELFTEAEVAVSLYYDGFAQYRPNVPCSIAGDSRGLYVGDLPRPGMAICGRVYPDGDSTARFDVWLRAEARTGA
jgi:hypothetical protein